MDRRIGTLLLQAHLIREDQLDQALLRQQERGGRLGTNLVEMGALGLDTLATALASQRGVPLASLNELELASGQTLALLPARLAAQLLAVPLSAGTAGVVVAVASPWDPAIAQALSASLKRPLLLKLAPELRILAYLEKLYRVPHPRKKAAAPPRPLPGPAPDLFKPLAPGEFFDIAEQSAPGPADPAAPAAAATCPAPAPGPIPGLDPIVAPATADPFSSPLQSALLPTLEVDEVCLDALDVSADEAAVSEPPDPLVEEVVPGELLVEETSPAPLGAPIARVKTPLVLGSASPSDPLATMSWDLMGAPAPAAPAPGAPPPAAPPPIAVVAPAGPAQPGLVPAPGLAQLAVPAERAPRQPAVATELELTAASVPDPLELDVAPAPARGDRPAEEAAWDCAPAAPRPATSLYLVEDALARATRPEKVVEDLLWACEGRFQAAVFFVLDGKRARARDAFGPSGAVPFHDGFSIDQATPSLIRSASDRQRPVLEQPSSPSDASLCARVGISATGKTAVIPFVMHGTVVGALWASCGSLAERSTLAEDIDRLSEMGARAFGRLPWGFTKS